MKWREGDGHEMEGRGGHEMGIEHNMHEMMRDV